MSVSFTRRPSELTQRAEQCVCVCEKQSSEVSPAEEITHACGSPHAYAHTHTHTHTHTHITLTYAGNAAAERACGMVMGFGSRRLPIVCPPHL